MIHRAEGRFTSIQKLRRGAGRPCEWAGLRLAGETNGPQSIGLGGAIDRVGYLRLGACLRTCFGDRRDRYRDRESDGKAKHRGCAADETGEIRGAKTPR